MAPICCRCNLVYVVTALVICMFTHCVYGAPQTYFMEDYCVSGEKKQVFVGGEGVSIYSQREPEYGINLSCRITLNTDNGLFLSLKSKSIALESGLDCIELINGQHSLPVSIRHCNNDPLMYTTTQRYLTIVFTTDATTSKAGFKLLVTQLNNTAHEEIPCYSGSGDYQCFDGNGCYSDYDKCDAWSSCADRTDNLNCDTCDEGGFLCASSRLCISSYDVCDGNPDCADGEDENLPECYPTIWLYWNGGQLAGTFIGFVIFLVIVIVIVAVVHKKCRK